jgi:hypothetical protein
MHIEIDLGDSQFEPAETCPKCEATVFENKTSPNEKHRVATLTKICENSVGSNPSCSYYEQITECPDCGGNLTGKSSGPGHFVGARSGSVSCEECEFGFNWSE